ncbi:DUF6638 family protein [Pseudoruegeria sp. HB172150]|uniref:DUF6638 family protein n=1 Tax=Pseudoruegeria sp. HB172150 TaxID=2721164 RepID=UPI001551FB57|nr:DUF6638 family protein [Pseudoruegeria sp. HB172150]
MKRLIEMGLMFGNLVRVDSPALVERYNRALTHLTGKTTEQTDFHIDISGFSPEIGDELGDDLYLNPNGCNRQFILLTTEQKSAPLLNARFSFSRRVLRDFIEANEAKLFALVTRDAVAGELMNSVLEVGSPQRLFDIQRIVVEADTTGGDVRNARKLQEKIERFRNEDDAWWDDVLIAEMIGLAKQTGDVTRNPVDLSTFDLQVPDFWTAHYGGLYVFRGVEHPAAIASGDREALGELPIRYVLGLNEPNRIAKFFELNGLVEPIVKARGIDGAAILRQKMDFILVDAAATLGHDMSVATRRDLRMLARQLGSALPEAYHGLAALLRWAEGGGDWPRIASDHPAYFYTLRAAAGPQMELVNQLLAELTPLDVRQLFICHKQLFYDLYRGWSEAKKEYVAEFLAAEYAVDKAGTRAALFGQEPGMEEPEAEQEPVARREDLINLVGPWGAVRRS